MDGLFILIAIAIAIMNFSQKQNRNQKKAQESTKRQPGMMRQNPAQYWMKNIQKANRTAGGPANPREKRSMLSEDSEGIELEDRSRRGSLDYTGQSQKSEGICIELAHEHKKEREAAPKIEVIENEDNIFGLTEESLLRSIVMAEVLGPPRAIKRKIR